MCSIFALARFGISIFANLGTLRVRKMGRSAYPLRTSFFWWLSHRRRPVRYSSNVSNPGNRGINFFSDGDFCSARIFGRDFTLPKVSPVCYARCVLF